MNLRTPGVGLKSVTAFARPQRAPCPARVERQNLSPGHPTSLSLVREATEPRARQPGGWPGPRGATHASLLRGGDHPQWQGDWPKL